MDRSSGILMPISSLSSNYGIGTLGKKAYEFIDFLANSLQSNWQMLPVGPTSYGDSPYQSFSAFAGNPYFIDLDFMIEDGLLTNDELLEINWSDINNIVDYEKIFLNRFEILKKAFNRFENNQEIDDFKLKNSFWLRDYALFMSLKKHFDMKMFTEWEDSLIVARDEKAIEEYTNLLIEDILFFEFVQYLFFSQWDKLKMYANQKGISLIGDIPIYASMDSADVWANLKVFLLDKNNLPAFVAGVPPDYFSSDGQLWGNPLYNWEYLDSTGYEWWIKRISQQIRLFDKIRIDHFRGFESFWAIPYGDKTAVNGKWIKGPGMKFISEINKKFSNIQIIAEDLGILTDDVRRLLNESGYPGMKILQFAFNSEGYSDYLPHRYINSNCVVYTGTHDNTTTKAWLDENNQDVFYAVKYLGLNSDEGYTYGMIRGAMSSIADLCIIPIQDFLELDASSRMNEPSTLGNNWTFRIGQDILTKELEEKIAFITKMYGRDNGLKN